MTRSVVMIESPFWSNDPEIRKVYSRYLDRCLLDSVLRGEAPIASHAIYTRIFVEFDEYDGRPGRDIGLECRDAIAESIPCVRYVDFGISSGMRRPGVYLLDRKIGKCQ